MPDPTTPLDLSTWCAQTAERHRDMEEHELAMYPSPDARDAAIVEWTVRVLGNPDAEGSAAVVAALAARHGAAGEIAELIRERDQAREQRDNVTSDLDHAREQRDQARAERDQLAAALNRATSIRVDAHGVIWHAAPDGHWRHRIYGTRTLDQVDAIFGRTSPALLVPIDDDAEQLTLAWLERHRLPACPSPPEVLRAVALDVAAGTLHGRRERWILDGLVGGYVCAEPDPAGPDGICGMPVEDVPCTIHHPGGDRR